MLLWQVVAYKGNLNYYKTDHLLDQETRPDSGWTGEWCQVSLKLERDYKVLRDPKLAIIREDPCLRCDNERVFVAAEGVIHLYGPRPTLD